MTENLCLLFSECRKVTTQKCFKHSHASMLKRNLGWVMGKTEPTEKWGKLNWIFWVSTEREYQHRPLWKNWKMAAIYFISIIQKNFQLPTPPPQSLGLRFSKCQQKWTFSVGHYEKLKNGCHFFNINRMEKFSITNPPKVWVSGFLSVNRNRISVLAIMKKLKNGCHFLNINRTEKFPITNPPWSLGLWFFRVSMEMEYQHRPLWKNWRKIYVWLHLKHLCVDIYAWFTSHLCVVLHFLIFIEIWSNSFVSCPTKRKLNQAKVT